MKIEQTGRTEQDRGYRKKRLIRSRFKTMLEDQLKKELDKDKADELKFLSKRF